MDSKLINTLEDLDRRAYARFWVYYLPLLSRSIKVSGQNAESPAEFMQCKGWGTEFMGYDWGSRASRWYAKGDVPAAYADGKLVDTPRTQHYHYVIPLFPGYVKQALAKLERDSKGGRTRVAQDIKPKIKQEETKMSKFKITADSIIDKNKEAVKLAAKLATGKTANSFFLNKLVGKFPWYAKVFSKKNKVADNPIAKLVAAETAMTLITHFAPDNQKLNYIAEGMIQEALVDITVNSTQLEKMIGDLESMVTLPDFDKG